MTSLGRTVPRSAALDRCPKGILTLRAVYTGPGDCDYLGLLSFPLTAVTPGPSAHPSWLERGAWFPQVPLPC